MSSNSSSWSSRSFWCICFIRTISSSNRWRSWGAASTAREGGPHPRPWPSMSSLTFQLHFSHTPRPRCLEGQTQSISSPNAALPLPVVITDITNQAVVITNITNQSHSFPLSLDVASESFSTLLMKQICHPWSRPSVKVFWMDG